MLVIVAGVIVTWEWGRLVRGTGLDRIAIVEVTRSPPSRSWSRSGSADLPLSSLAVAAVAVGLLSLSSGHAPLVARRALLYAALPASALVWLRSDSVARRDSRALSLRRGLDHRHGVLCRRPRSSAARSSRPDLAEQDLGGPIVGTFAPASSACFALLLKDTSGLRLALVSVAIAVVCQLGDLERERGEAKVRSQGHEPADPGHGGLLDRIDGLLFAASRRL